MNKKAVIYARVSTREQAEEELPVASQVEACERKAKLLEADVVRVFKDEGISGRTAQRPAFIEAIEYCAVFEVDYLVLWDTKRFARNHVDAAIYKRELRRGGTKVVYVAHDFDTEDGWLLEGIFNLIDEQHSRNVSRDTKRSMMKNARDGHFNGGRVPFGYAVVPDGKRKRLKIVDHEAMIVRRIFSECLAGAGTKSIALGLNLAGIHRRGKPWTKNTIGQVLASWVYAGYITFNRTNHADRATRPPADWIREKSHQPIIQEEDLVRAQQVMTERAPREGNSSPKSGFLFTGMLRCGECGMGLQIETATGRSKTYSYYNCAGALKGKGCRNRRIPAAEYDAHLLEFLMSRILNKERLQELATEVHELQGEWLQQRKDRRAALVAELRDAEARRANLLDVLELHGRNAPNLADLSARLRTINARVASIEKSLTELEVAPAPTPTVNELELSALAGVVTDIVWSAEAKKVREFLASFIEKVVVMKEDSEIHYYPDRLVSANQVDTVHSAENWLPDRAKLRTVVVRATLPQRFKRAA